MKELHVLQAVRLKGRANSAAVEWATGLSEHEVGHVLESLREQDLVQGDAAVRITPRGQEVLSGWLDDERAGIDQDALANAYASFDALNTAVKAAISAWQTKPDGEVNDHTDAEYDRSVVDRICDLDTRFQPLLAEFVRLAARLSPYPSRFARAIEKMRAGEHSYVARPIQDSYHTVWFELHEDLLGLRGLRRLDEARAGRA